MTTTVDHESVMNQVLAVCRMALLIDPEDLAELGNQFTFEDVMAPLLDPSLVKKSQPKFQNAKNTLDAFATFYREIRRIDAGEQARVAKEKGRKTP